MWGSVPLRRRAQAVIIAVDETSREHPRNCPMMDPSLQRQEIPLLEYDPSPGVIAPYIGELGQFRSAGCCVFLLSRSALW